MKLKILPPTLRVKNHYLTLDIKSEVKLTKDELVSAIWYSCLRLYGEAETSGFNLWIMRFYTHTNNDFLSNNLNTISSTNKSDNDSSLVNKDFDRTESNYYHYKAVLRCQRGYENKVRGSLATLYKHNNKKIAISTIGISGTISSSIEKFIN